MAQPYPGADIKTIALVLAWNVGMVTVATGSIVGGFFIARDALEDVAERSRIIRTARASGFSVSGLVYKDIKFK